MIKPIALSATHMECQSLKETVPVLTDLLAFEKLAENPGEVKLKHPNTDLGAVCARDGRGCAGQADAQSLGRPSGNDGRS